MMGIEFVSKLYGIGATQIAKRCNIKNPNVNAWYKGERKIPERHLISMCELFPSIPIEYFQKELDITDRQEIVKCYINNLANSYNIGIKIY